MTHKNESASLGIRLPDPPPPAGNYQPVTIRNGFGFVSGQVPVRDGRLLYTGRVGVELTPQQGTAAAEIAALNVLAQIDRALPMNAPVELVVTFAMQPHDSSEQE